MKHQVPISVCMPMYNASEYLQECMESILSQSFVDFELLIVDDGSTDNSRDIVRSYNDARIRLIENRHDYIETLNIMLHQAQGKYIARMDADDIMMPGRLQVQYTYMEEHPDVDIWAGAMQIYGKDEVIVPPVIGRSLQVKDFLGNNLFGNPATIIRTDTLRKLQVKYQDKYIYAEDYGFWSSMACAGANIVCTDKVFFQYRLSENQTSQKKFEQMWESNRIVKNDLEHWISDKYLAEYTMPGIENRGNMLTIIIPFLNEGEEIVNTVKSIRETVGAKVDIMVINDQSYDEYPYRQELQKYDVFYILNKDRKGVAASRDYGVSLCQTPYFLLLDGHMRFYDGNWAERIVSLLKQDDRVLLCCQTRFLEKDENGIVTQSNCPTCFGAMSTFDTKNYCPNAEWNTHELYPGECIEPIAYVLGAGYAASKRYWTYLHGLKGLKSYGSDEAFISNKVWREGGKCLLVKDVVIGHIYRNTSPFRRYVTEEISNRLLVAYLTFSQSWYCIAATIALRKDTHMYSKAIKILQEGTEYIEEEKKYLSSIFTKEYEDILPLHKRALSATKNYEEEAGLFSRINDFIIEHPAQNTGLFDGKAGQLIWFCQYGKWSSDKSLENKKHDLWNDIHHAVEKRMLSWNFSQGLSGIGWTCIYLYLYSFIDSYPTQILSDIDKQLQEISLEKISTAKIETGGGGILAYAVLRTKTGTPTWDEAFSLSLEKLSKRILENPTNDFASMYYAMFYLHIRKHGVKKETYYPRISEWLPHGSQLPTNSRYWKASIYDGCIGAVIGFIDNNKYNSYV